MNSTIYKNLCSYCDKILLSKKSKVETIAINWLHVSKGHPSLLKKYNSFLTFNENEFFLFSLIKYLYRVFLKFFTHFIKFLLSKNKIQNHQNNFSPIDILFVSHLTSKDQNNDRYFGSCSEILKEQGVKSETILINHLPDVNCGLLNKITEKNFYILSKYLSLFDEIKLILRMVKESVRLLKEFFKVKNPILKKTYFYAAQESLSTQTINALRIGEQVQSYIRKANPKIIVTTFEGYSWERVVYYYSRKVDSQILCIAYQHSIVLKKQHSILRNLSKDYNPDQILCAGIAGVNFFSRNYSSVKIPVNLLGSNKYNSKSKVNDFNQKNFDACLVIPEGIIDECIALFSFSLESALINPSIDFIWRLHPIISFEYLVSKCNKFKKLPTNIIISKETTIEEDAQKTLCTLYRGSSAVINTSLNGSLPIYLDLLDDLNISPLQVLNTSFLSVSNIDDFGDVYSDIKNTIKYKNDLSLLNEECKDFFCDLNVDPLVSHIRL